LACEIEIVSGSVEDVPMLGQLFYEAVHEGALAYTPAQRRAWAPEPKSGEDFLSRLASQSIRIAKDGDIAVGFMTMTNEGYVDFAYIISRWQGCGLFPRLFDPLEEIARLNRVASMNTHASLMARSAFKKVGFRQVEEEVVELKGEKLHRYVMTKQLLVN